MKKHTWILFALGLTVSRAARADDDAEAAFKPLPGRDVVKPMKADWCDDADIESWLGDGGTDRAIHAVERAVGSGYGEKALREIAELGCIKPSDPELQKAVAKFRQGYINLVGTSEADDRAAMKVRVSAKWDKQKAQYCDSVKPGGDEDSLESKSLAEALSAGTGCTINGHGGMALTVYAEGMNPELGWWLDAHSDTKSEIVRAVYVTRCLRILRNNADWPDASDTWVMQSYATCGPDARRLDRARLDKELADPKFNDFAKVNAREVFAQAKTVADHLTTELTKLAAKDEGYKKLLFDAPEAGWKQWEADYAAHKDALDAALDYERKFYGPSKKALLGCGDKLRANFAGYVQSKRPKTPDEAKRAALDAVGYPLLTSLALCDGAEGRLQLAQTEVSFLTGDGEGPPNLRRGPRFAAYYAAAAALGEILADRSKFPIHSKEFYLRVETPRESVIEGARDYFTNKVQFNTDPRGLIADVKKDGDGVMVSFKAVHTTMPNRICTPNGRLLRIDSGGNLIYDSDCVTKGTITLTTQEKPLFIPNVVAGGLAAGQTATFSVDESHGKRNGMPKLVYADKDGKHMVNWLGVKL